MRQYNFERSGLGYGVMFRIPIFHAATLRCLLDVHDLGPYRACFGLVMAQNLAGFTIDDNDLSPWDSRTGFARKSEGLMPNA